MKNAAAYTKKITSVLKGLKKKADMPEADTDPIEVLVKSVLMWESTSDKADAMYAKLVAATVDWNDLRVCMPQEIAELAGDKSVEAMERATRLKMSMRSVYLRHHEVTLEPERTGRKREVKSFIEKLEGIPSSAAARLLSVCFDVPTIAVDSQVADLFKAKGALPEDATAEDLSSMLNKQVSPAQVLDTLAKLQAWVDGDHTKLQATRKKARQAHDRAAAKARKASQDARADRQKARAKAAEEARKAAEEKARLREAKKAQAEERKIKAAQEREAKAVAAEAAKKAKAAAKKKAAKKKVTKKKAAKKTTKKVAKKTTKKVAKKTTKKVAKRKTTKKAAKKVAKRKTTKKVAKRKSTRRS
ncbi:MAG: hypothetical protein MK074_01725 [Phycisphaerales bacterium]|nr:hypothetical protein [Phycisphaerales bacterium]